VCNVVSVTDPYGRILGFLDGDTHTHTHTHVGKMMFNISSFTNESRKAEEVQNT
jgi:hypothetical protein